MWTGFRWTSCLHISYNAEWEERFCQILLHVLLLDISMQSRANQTNGLAADDIGCDERGRSVFVAHVQFRFTSCVPSTSSPGILCAPSHRSSVEDPEWDWTPGLHCYLPVSQLDSVPLVTMLGPDTEPIFSPSRFSKHWLMLFLSSLKKYSVLPIAFLPWIYLLVFLRSPLSPLLW